MSVQSFLPTSAPMLRNPLGQPYRALEGALRLEIPSALDGGYQALSIADIVMRRMEVLTRATYLRRNWWDYAFQAGDVALYTPDGSVKLVRNAVEQLQLSPVLGSYLDGALVCADDLLCDLEGLVLSRQEVDEMHCRPLTPREVEANHVWLYLLQDNAHLLKNYVDAVVRHGGPNGEPKQPDMASMWLAFSPPPLLATVSLIAISDAPSNDSSLFIGSSLESPFGRLAVRHKRGRIPASERLL